MRKFSRVLAIVLVLTMAVCTLSVGAMADTYDDIAGLYPAAKEAVEYWTSVGVLHGDNGHFRPYDNMTRAEAATLISELLNLTEVGDISGFVDVPDVWYHDPIAKCYSAGIMVGTDATHMSPNIDLSRETLFVLLGRALGIEPAETANRTFVDSSKVSSWAVGMVNALINIGAINGNDRNELRPTDNITREQVAVFLRGLVGNYVVDDGETVEAVTNGKVTIIAASGVKVTSPAGTTVNVVLAGNVKTVGLAGLSEGAAVHIRAPGAALVNVPGGIRIVVHNVYGVTLNGAKLGPNDDFISVDY